MSKAEAAMRKLEAAAVRAAEVEEKVRKAREAGGLVIDNSRSAADKLTKVWERQRAAIDPVFSAHQKYLKSINDGTAAVARGTVSYNDAVKVIDVYRQRHEEASKAIDGVNDNTRLAAHQMGNLRSQAIDIGTMFAGGASPFQIMSSQAGQIYEALAGGQGGLTGGLKALGNSALAAGRTMLGALGPIGVAATVATAAAGALWYALSGESKAAKAEKAIESYEGALRSLKGSFAATGDAADAFETTFARRSARSAS